MSNMSAISELKGINKRCYLGLKIKCLNPVCEVISDVETFANHDKICDVTFKFCQDCGYKSRRGSNDVHSCFQVMKNIYDAKLDQMKEDNVQTIVELKQEIKSKKEKNSKCKSVILLLLGLYSIKYILSLPETTISVVKDIYDAKLDEMTKAYESKLDQVTGKLEKMTVEMSKY